MNDLDVFLIDRWYIIPAMDASAQSAFSATWPLAARLKWARVFAQRVVTRRADLCALMAAEVGKPEFEALTADIGSLIAACRWHARFAPGILADRRVPGGGWIALGTRAVERRVPLGRVGIIATWNYPVQLLGIQLVQAIVAGNRVVVKPSELAPRTQALLLDLARDAGLSGDYLKVLPATREAGGELLEGHFGHLDHLIFTGSTAVGRQIATNAGARLLPTTLELSGRDSAIVLDDADPVLAARAIWSGVTINSGQTCTAPRRVLVDRRVYRGFLAALAPLASGAKPRRVISADAARRCFEQAREAVEVGVGGRQGLADSETPRSGSLRARSLSGVFEPPTGRTLVPLAIADCPPDAHLVAGDHFGPVLAIVPVDDEAAMLSIHNQCDQHLAASIFTRRPARAQALAPRLHASFVTINQCLVPLGHPGATFGGHRASGWGLSRGREGLLAMTRPVTVTTTSRWIRPPVGDPSRRTVEAISRFLGWIAGAERAVLARGAGARVAESLPTPLAPLTPQHPPVSTPVRESRIEHKPVPHHACSKQDQPA